MSDIFITCSRRRIPIFSALFDYRNLIVFYPWIMRVISWKLKKFRPKRVVISSFAIGKNISIPLLKEEKRAETKLYLHSPMQYIWSHREEYFAKFTGRKKKLFSFLVPRLQKWDKQFTQFDEVICNSHYTQTLAKEIYGIA